MLVFVFLIWQFIQFFIDLGKSYDSAIAQLGTKDSAAGVAALVSNTIEVAYILAMILFAIIWYFVYYIPKYKARLQKDPTIQQTLDAQFVVVDDWHYVMKEIQDELDNYLVRNKAIHHNQDNENLQDALHIREEALTLEGDLREE
ncbi:N-terminal truncated transmembrane protein [Spiroplasma eriocheiris CCTCC M 207170]|nr:N-terminal truncated transmembrane protein [Spiroplasma eriocheiris CCTCC M 207170]